MSRKIDMMGMRVGALTVTADAPSLNGRRMVICKCDCGNTLAVNASNLRRGMTTSCGCAMARAEKRRGAAGKRLDITGQTFGELTAVEYIQRDRWLFRCSCGKTKALRPSLVKSGKIVSCGHVLAETAARKITEYNAPQFFDGTAISQLRSSTAGKSAARPGNATGHIGVSVVRRASGIRYRARLMLRGKEISLGVYDTVDAAIAARKDGERRYYVPLIEQYDDTHKDIHKEEPREKDH